MALPTCPTFLLCSDRFFDTLFLFWGTCFLFRCATSFIHSFIPTQKPFAELRELSARLITAASVGDMITCASIAERYGVGLLNTGDYDGRTPLHLATSNAQVAVVHYLLSRKGLVLGAVDRWGATPMDDALQSNHAETIALMTQALSVTVAQ